MGKETKIEVDGLALLREPFPANQISKLPKETRAQIDERKGQNGRNVMVFNCPECGGHHHRNAVHLDYVGHAALTDRLLDADINWSWEPLAFDGNGLPAMDQNGGLWIKLTVDGVTRLGYGSADGKSGGDAVKEKIGDALRNAAMRFGAALDLWHKGDLHAEAEEAPAETEAAPKPWRKPPQRAKLDGPYPSASKLAEEFHKASVKLAQCQTNEEIDKLVKWIKPAITQAKEDYTDLLNGDPDNEDIVGFIGEVAKRRAAVSEESTEYQLLVSTLNECGTKAEYLDWQKKHGMVADSLCDEERDRLEKMCRDYEAGFEAVSKVAAG